MGQKITFNVQNLYCKFQNLAINIYYFHTGWGKATLKNHLVYVQGKNHYTINLQNVILSLHSVTCKWNFKEFHGTFREKSIWTLWGKREQKLNTSKVICSVKKMATNIKDGWHAQEWRTMLTWLVWIDILPSNTVICTFSKVSISNSKSLR